MDRPAASIGQERLEDGGLADRGRQVDLARHRPGAAVVLLEEAAQDLVIGRLARRVEQEHVAPDHLAVADDEQLDGRLVVLARQPEQVELGPREGRHLLALHRPLDGPDLVAQRGRPFVLGPLGRGGHLAVERLDEGLLATLEEQLDLGDVGPVGVRPDGRDARALAALDVVQQARPLERADAVLDVDRARPEREEPADQVHRFVDARRRGVRPEVAAAVVDQLAGALDPREVVAQRDLDVRVALVVLEPDVEARPVALDQVGLEQERLRDRIGLGDLDVRDPVDDAPDPVDLATERLLLPVRADAVAQALRLADVDDVAARVLHEVHARLVGQLGEGGSELGGHRPMLPPRGPERRKPRRGGRGFRGSCGATGAGTAPVVRREGLGRGVGVEHARQVLDRGVAGARAESDSKRCSIVARIDVVSCEVLSTTKSPFRYGEMTSAGMRVPGPQMSCGPALPMPGGGT